MLCRLCIKESACTLNIFDSDGIKLEIAEILGRHFWFKPRPDDRMSQAVCTICWSKIYNFHQFYVTIEEAHSRLCASNVEKEFIGEYIANEFNNKQTAIKEEFTNSAVEEEKLLLHPAKELPEISYSRIAKRKESACIETGLNTEKLFCAKNLEKEFVLEHVDNDFNDIGIIAKEQNSVTPCSMNENQEELAETEFIEIGYNSKEFSETPSSGLAQNTTVNLKITKSKVSAKQFSGDPVPGELIAEVGTLNEKCNKFNNEKVNHINSLEDVTLSYSNAEEPVQSKHKPTKPVKGRKRLTTTKKKLVYSKKQHSSKTNDNEKNKLKNSSPSTCDALDPALLKEKFDEPQEHSKKRTKFDKNRKKLSVSEKKIAELRLKRGVKASSSDEELVKKYIPMRCNECIFDCENFTLLRNHFQVDHPNTKPYVKCCNRKWLHWMSIVHHAYKHDDPDLLKCQECQKDFNDLGTLSRHMLDHHTPEEDQIFSCDVCPRKFARKIRLDLHRSTHVPMNERTFICDKCPNSRFGCKTMLLIHNKKVHRNTSYVCHVCAKKIKTKAFFEKHVRLHFEESGPKVKCTVDGCDHWLKDEDCLRLHLRRFHSKNKDKIFTCEVCGGEYKSRASITNHMLRVHPKTTYPCKICNKTFKRTRNLNDHMAQHTGKSNYTCLFCTCTFNTHGNYYTHLKKSHPVEYENWLKNKK